MEFRFPGESKEYRAAREALLQKEVEAKRVVEAAARARRELPLGGLVPEDYIFTECDGSGVARPVKFSDLMTERHDTLAIYSYMYGEDMKVPCRMCTPLLDAWNGVEDHIRQRLNFAAVAGSPPERLWKWKRERGWDRLRLLSSLGTTYSKSYYGVDEKGHDDTRLNIFRRVDGKIYHFWASEMTNAMADPGQNSRALDLLNPIFNMFDLTPEGRGDWLTKISYE